VAAATAIDGGSIVHRLDFDLRLHRLTEAADGDASGDYRAKVKFKLETVSLDRVLLATSCFVCESNTLII